ncbi:MAG: hypothetical protein DRG78_03790 [Epsilonproteobacteria bacterium]|nr:MAG: hypothetical protein DRG78_03790 [Campylobacterota bacterium]
MSRYHITLSLGRSDSVVVQSKNATDVKAFFKDTSEAIVRNVKRILFSKEYNMNYKTVPEVVAEEVYHKVIVQALTESYSHTYTLFNIKKTITKDDIITQFKKLKIQNEDITDFSEILFFEDKDSSPNIKNLYQIVYKRESRTFTEELYAKSWQRAKEVADILINGEVVEVRKFSRITDKIKKDKGNYLPSKKVTIFDGGIDKFHYTFKIPKLKSNIDDLLIIDSANNNLQIANNKPSDIKVYS